MSYERSILKRQSHTAHSAALLLGRFRVVDVLSDSTLGMVIKVFDVDSARLALNKKFSCDLGLDGFARELHALRSLRGASFTALTDWGLSPEGDLLIAIEYLPGEDLRTTVVESRLPADRFALLKAVGEALDQLHAIGIIHDDGFLGSRGASSAVHNIINRSPLGDKVPNFGDHERLADGTRRSDSSRVLSLTSLVSSCLCVAIRYKDVGTRIPNQFVVPLSSSPSDNVYRGPECDQADFRCETVNLFDTALLLFTHCKGGKAALRIAAGQRTSRVAAAEGAVCSD